MSIIRDIDIVNIDDEVIEEEIEDPQWTCNSCSCLNSIYRKPCTACELRWACSCKIVHLLEDNCDKCKEVVVRQSWICTYPLCATKNFSSDNKMCKKCEMTWECNCTFVYRRDNDKLTCDYCIQSVNGISSKRPRSWTCLICKYLNDDQKQKECKQCNSTKSTKPKL